jgi:hypothetical protein
VQSLATFPDILTESNVFGFRLGYIAVHSYAWNSRWKIGNMCAEKKAVVELQQ